MEDVSAQAVNQCTANPSAVEHDTNGNITASCVQYNGYTARCVATPEFCKYGAKYLLRELLVCADPPGENSGDANLIILMNTLLKTANDARSAGDSAAAESAIRDAQLLTYRYGVNGWFEVFYQMESGPGLTQDVGASIAYGWGFPSATQAHSLGLRFAAYGGWGSANGGYASPTGNLLTPVQFSRLLIAIEPDVEGRFSINRRFQVLGRVGLRVGANQYSQADNPTQVSDQSGRALVTHRSVRYGDRGSGAA